MNTSRSLLVILLLLFAIMCIGAWLGFLPEQEADSVKTVPTDSSMRQESEGPTVLAGTPRELEDLLNRAFENRSVGQSMSRPGGASIDHTEEMDAIVQLGDTVIPNLIANLKNEDPKFRLIVIEMLAMLNAKEAVPPLIEALSLNDEFEDNLIAARLATITQHPNGYRFSRRWFDEKVRREAVAAYHEWARANLATGQ